MTERSNRGDVPPVASVPAWLGFGAASRRAGIMLQNAGYLPGFGGRAARSPAR